jgi:intein/homing endonuclease
MGEKDVLERAKIAFEKEFNRKFEIKLYSSQKKGSIRGGVKATKDMFRLMNTGTGSKEITEKFINMFYTEYKEKKVPLEILNADKKSQEQFLMGYIAGDGYLIKKKRKSWVASCKSRIALFGLQILSEKIGWAFSISYDKRIYGKRKTCPSICFYPDGIKKTNKFITEENKNEPRSLYFYKQFYRENRGEQEVYDINTASGHFFANNFLVHNCDKRAMFVTAMVSFYFAINTVRPIYCEVWRVGDGQFAFYHYANVFVTDNGQAFLWDADSDGQITKITTQDPVIGNKRFHLLKVA